MAGIGGKVEEIIRGVALVAGVGGPRLPSATVPRSDVMGGSGRVLDDTGPVPVPEGDAKADPA